MNGTDTDIIHIPLLSHQKLLRIQVPDQTWSGYSNGTQLLPTSGIPWLLQNKAHELKHSLQRLSDQVSMHSFWMAPLHTLFWAKKKPHVLKTCKGRGILQKYKHQMQIPSFCASQHASPEADLVCKCPKLTVVILYSYISWYHKNFLANAGSNIAKGADNRCLRQLLGLWPLILEPLWAI